MAWLFLVAAVLVPRAHAQSFSFTEMGQVLGPDPGVTFASQSVGAPSITWDSRHSQLVMMFESRTPTTHADCAKGVWAVGMATSTDGTNWSIESTGVVMPDPTGTKPYACVAAHPAAVFTNVNPNGKVQVYWKGESQTTCAAVNCEYEGIGRAIVTLDATGGLGSVSIQAGPVIAFPATKYGGYPRAVKVGSTFYMTAQLYPYVYTFTSSNPSVFAGTQLAFSPDDPTFASYTWVYDEFMAPSVICDDSPMEFGLFVGSRDTDYGTVVQGAIGKAISANWTTWALSSTTSITFTGDDDYRHFDVIRLDSNEYLMYYSVKDASGNSTIHLAATDPGFDLSTDTPVGKVCP